MGGLGLGGVAYLFCIFNNLFLTGDEGLKLYEESEHDMTVRGEANQGDEDHQKQPTTVKKLRDEQTCHNVYMQETKRMEGGGGSNFGGDRKGNYEKRVVELTAVRRQV